MKNVERPTERDLGRNETSEMMGKRGKNDQEKYLYMHTRSADMDASTHNGSSGKS